MDGHSAAPIRSRSSQYPSPSHSASASASSSVHHKRIPGASLPAVAVAVAAAAATAAPFSLSGALASNDDLDSISAWEEEDGTEEEEEEDEDKDEEKEDHDTMRAFTAAHLEPPSGVSSSNPTSTKPSKAENPSTKVEPSGEGLSEIGLKDERGATVAAGQQNAAAAVSLMPGIVVKDDTV